MYDEKFQPEGVDIDKLVEHRLSLETLHRCVDPIKKITNAYLTRCEEEERARVEALDADNGPPKDIDDNRVRMFVDETARKISPKRSNSAPQVEATVTQNKLFGESIRNWTSLRRRRVQDCYTGTLGGRYSMMSHV